MRKNEDAGSSHVDDVVEDAAQQDEEDDDYLLDDDDDHEKPDKKHKTGIIFIPTIPPYMTVTILREMLGEFGEIGRVYLQEDKNVEARFKKVRRFSEGWIEFKKKKRAKWVAENLNNAKMSSRKKSKFYDYSWNLKYLPRFKWAHLSERLAYEQAVHRQRMRTEISQAKKEAAHFQLSLEKSQKIQKFKRKQQLMDVMADQGFQVPQRKLDSEHKKKPKQKEQRAKLLSNLFGSNKK